jgi:hypothetical protein
VALSFNTEPQRFDRLRLAIGLLAPLILIVILTAACGDDDGDAGATTTADMSTTSPPDTLVDSTDAPQGDDVPECDHTAIDSTLRDALGSGDGPEIDRVEITNCDGGYARVLVIPTESNFETEQVFLQNAGGGAWQIVDFGTGISCEDDDLTSELEAACEALGLR